MSTVNLTAQHQHSPHTFHKACPSWEAACARAHSRRFLWLSKHACRWVHVITTRYTFVNTLQLLGPDARLDNQTAITLAEHEPQRVASGGSASQDLAELDRQTMDSITWGN